jgi:hypothetical protein
LSFSQRHLAQFFDGRFALFRFPIHWRILPFWNIDGLERQFWGLYPLHLQLGNQHHGAISLNVPACTQIQTDSVAPFTLAVEEPLFGQK